MTIVSLYRYQREGGGVTVSPIKPDAEYTLTYRLIADEGKELVKGDIRVAIIDTDNIEGWIEEEIEVE